MTEIYGARLQQSFGTTLPQAWRDRLSKLAPESIAAALTRCEESGDDWPPGLPKFLAMCRGGDSLHNRAAYRIVDKSRLIEQQPDPEVVSGAMDRIREVMQGGTRPQCDANHTENEAGNLAKTPESKS